MPVLVTSKFGEDLIKNEQASLETPFSHYKSVGNFQTLKARNFVESGPIWPKFEVVREFMHVLITCKFEKDLLKKQQRKGGDIVFPIISQWALSVAMETRVLIQSVPKPYAAFLPPI